MESWLQHQRAQLRAALISIRDKPVLRVTQPFFRIDSASPDLEVFWADASHYDRNPEFTADIFFNQGYSPDHPRLVAVRNQGHASLHATWLWDNHHLFADSMHSAMLSDVYFYAHEYRSHYLKNEISLDGGAIPLCPIFWTLAEVEQAARMVLLAPRSNDLYGGYNSYEEFPERDVLLENIKLRIPTNNIFITPHGTPPELHRFYSMSTVERLTEWMHYKVSLCVSFGDNTAIRIFDMLLGGGIPLVVGRPKDLDAIIPRRMQEELPVLVIDDFEPEAIGVAYQLAIRRFDDGGPDGVMTRHEYIKRHHMPHHRLAQMVNKIRSFAERAEDMT